MVFRISKIVLLFILVSVFTLPIFGSFVFGEENLTEKCEEIINKGQQELSKEDYQSLLKECQIFYEGKIGEIEKDISKTGQEKQTLQNKIYNLSKKIKNLNYQIYQSNLIIKDLEVQTENTTVSIKKISLKIKDSKERLANILRTIYEEDQKPAIEIFLSEPKLSDFFDNLISLEILNNENRKLLENIKDLKLNLEQQNQDLKEEKGDLEQMVQIHTFQKNESAKTKNDQEYYWNLTEREYQKQLQEKKEIEKKAAEIQAKIYELIGVRKDVTYKEALEVAKYAASQLGIRPALLLGVLSQESAIGRNVGQCYVKNSSTGAGVIAYNGKTIAKVMNPTRDIPPFLNIIKELNNNKGLTLDPFETLVSCPMSFGWGGAMGPAQFIPSTWALYENRIREKVGSSPDPWDIRDASIAASIYLKDGIDKYGTEGRAVQAYFCGRPKNTYWCSWYERNVLYLAKCHQTFIDTGSMSLKCQGAVGLK